MQTVSATRHRSHPFTQRQLYFFLLWLPLLAHFVFFFSAVVHVPFALIHTWNTRRKPTRELLRASWQVPFTVAAFTVAIDLALSVYGAVTEPGKTNWEFGGSDLLYPAISFAVALALVCFGWLVLLTLASRWPLDGTPEGKKSFR
jgi:hypothetical protein